ncbi:hypothetical protein K458DRAFT_402542 [Lentithecium fluviatile CBS 122367]|uniref:Uncharacterized protein n=1 Tax=Lentithecium fluviatile CBS 122367 TaxID=1168545 RepID=A0A6G1J653_9PLEO|nr:hypothetical protein K458DRAFT_402542 [Lentithecium fluviatile CBS 122367]
MVAADGEAVKTTSRPERKDAQRHRWSTVCRSAEQQQGEVEAKNTQSNGKRGIQPSAWGRTPRGRCGGNMGDYSQTRLDKASLDGLGCSPIRGFLPKAYGYGAGCGYLLRCNCPGAHPSSAHLHLPAPEAAALAIIHAPNGHGQGIGLRTISLCPHRSTAADAPSLSPALRGAAHSPVALNVQHVGPQPAPSHPLPEMPPRTAKHTPNHLAGPPPGAFRDLLQRTP